MASRGIARRPELARGCSLLTEDRGNDTATKKLRAAQKAWLVFRDAHLQELYPAEDKQAEYGSMFPMCYSQVATAMTRDRTAQLPRMLDDKDPCELSGKGFWAQLPGYNSRRAVCHGKT